MEKTRQEELLAKMAALTGGERNNMDIFCTHEKIANFIIRNTFDTPDHRGKPVKRTMAEVLDFYRVESKLHELNLQREIKDFAQDVSDHEYMGEILWEATRAETKIMLKLINFANSCDGRAIFDRQLSVGEKNHWVEAILVTQDFIMLLKHHMPNHDVCITEEGKLCWYDVGDDRMDQKDEYRWFEERKEMLQHLLGSSDLEDKKFIYTAVWKSKYRFANKCRKINCVELEDLDEWLASLEPSPKDSNLDLDLLVAKITDAEVNDPPVPSIYPIIESYAALRSAYEEAMKDSRK